MITAYELGCLTVKQAAELPWRERVEVYAKHPRTGKIYGGMWNTDKSFAVPGGGVDSGETPEQAAIRELAEETGIHATNPVRLPIDPVDNPWSDAYRAEKGRNFAGSRTHFVLADYLKKDKDKQLDKWEANNRKFYAPEQALALMQGKQFLAPDVAAARIKAIQHILQGMQKQAADSTRAPKTYYHGSPNAALTALRPGSYVTPDLATAQLMGKFHEDTGKTWSDDDLVEPHMFGREPKWKAGREPKGVPTVYSVSAADDALDLLDNPYEHKTKTELLAQKLARLI